MTEALAFLGILLLSLVVALLAALQLGDFFNAGGELGLVILTVAGFTIVIAAVFALTYAVTPRASILTAAALVLALCALIPIALPGLIQTIADRSSHPFMVGAENIPIMLELLVPALIAVLVQWALVRRRWLRAAGEDDLTRWPWVTTVVAGLAILNPFGLTFLQETLQHAPTDATWQFTATVTAGGLAALLVMAWIECYIRDRVLNRRMAASVPPEAPFHGGEAQSQI
jgi:hypothetical protein